MNMKAMPGRVIVKKHEVKLKGSILLPPSRTKLYEIGEVVAVGDLRAYGPGGKSHSREPYRTGELVLFQLPASFAQNISFKVKGIHHVFLHAEDIIARLTSDTIELAAFRIAGRFLLLQPSLRQPSAIIVTPDNAEEARKDNLHFSVLQVGRDVEEELPDGGWRQMFSNGQEVFPDKGRCSPLVVENQELVFVDKDFILGAMEA